MLVMEHATLRIVIYQIVLRLHWPPPLFSADRPAPGGGCEQQGGACDSACAFSFAARQARKAFHCSFCHVGMFHL